MRFSSPRLRGLLVHFLALVILVGAVPNPLAAQGANSILYGQTVNGRISDDTARVVYAFRAAASEIIDARLARTEGDLDPVLLLLDPANNLLARDDDGGAGLDANLLAVPLPTDGVYFLVVTRFGGPYGSTRGAYTLSLERVGVVSDPALEAGGAVVIGYGDNVVQTIDDVDFQHIYTFPALRGDVINLRMQRISGDLDPVLTFADAAGVVIQINDEDASSPGSLDAAMLAYRVERSGNYLIGAGRFGGQAGTSRGAFSLTLEHIAPETMGFTPEMPLLLEYGQAVTGQINAETLTRYYLIQARGGDRLSIEVTRTAGSLDPILRLLTLDQQKLAEQDASARGRFARITSFNVPVDVSLLVVVSRFNGATGRTEGTYSLVVRASR